jgi:hypothetical protein
MHRVVSMNNATLMTRVPTEEGNDPPAPDASPGRFANPTKHRRHRSDGDLADFLAETSLSARRSIDEEFEPFKRLSLGNDDDGHGEDSANNRSHQHSSLFARSGADSPSRRWGWLKRRAGCRCSLRCCCFYTLVSVLTVCTIMACLKVYVDNFAYAYYIDYPTTEHDDVVPPLGATELAVVGNGPLTAASRAMLRAMPAKRVFRFNGMANMHPDEYNAPRPLPTASAHRTVAEGRRHAQASSRAPLTCGGVSDRRCAPRAGPSAISLRASATTARGRASFGASRRRSPSWV